MLALAAATPLLLARRARAGGAELNAAAAFIRSTGQEFEAAATASCRSVAEQQGLQPLIDRVVDVDGLARFCLGRFWPRATAGQRRDYLALFHRVLVQQVVGWACLYPYRPGQVVLGAPKWQGREIAVPMTVTKSGAPSVALVWMVRAEAGGLRITDLVAGGVSLRLLVQSDYSSFIARHGEDIGRLIEALGRQAAKG